MERGGHEASFEEEEEEGGGGSSGRVGYVGNAAAWCNDPPPEGEKPQVVAAQALPDFHMKSKMK